MEPNSESWIQSICDWLRGTSGESPTAAIDAALAGASGEQLANLLEVVSANFDSLSDNPRRFRVLMQLLAARFLGVSLTKTLTKSIDRGDVREKSVLDAAGDGEIPIVEPETLANLYELLGELDGAAAAHTLQILAAQRDEESIELLTQIVREAPPQNWKHVAVALSPLWNYDSQRLELFFELLFARADEGYLQPSTLSVLLDLAGYSFRAGKLSKHPWDEQDEGLIVLLSSIVNRLRALEREPAKFGADVHEVQRVLADGVALTVSLCDALGLVGRQSAEASLMQALELSHRRIHTEAAAALARLGCETGRQRLIELASDPVARLRAVNYADELGFADQIEQSLRLPAALAESELVAWLASAEQFGFPPSHIEFLEVRTLFWPSYDEPRDCYLFRYEYQFPTSRPAAEQSSPIDWSASELPTPEYSVKRLSNIGIAGPLTHAFQADLASLPTDDVYAAFAGWQAEHEDIYEIPMQLLSPAQRSEADRLLAHLENHELEIVEALGLTFFLGEVAVLAIVKRGDKRASAITDGLELFHQPLTDSPTSLTPDILLAIYRGRKLLRTFNPDY
jgi:hypothetical protein